MSEQATLHLTTVAIGGRGVLIEGPSGAGKSDLALRLIDRGAVLVSDDYTELREASGVLLARAPVTIAGKMEVRGLGIVTSPCLAEAPVALLVSLARDIERFAAPASRVVCGVAVPVFELDPLPASAPIKVELALK